MKINFLKKEKNFKKKNFTFNYNLCWQLFLAGALGLILLFFFFGYFLFRQINQELALSAVKENTETSKINQNRIEKTLNYFSAREEKSTEIINSPAPVVDPSL